MSGSDGIVAASRAVGRLPSTLSAMRLARGLEQRLENLVDGVSASVFRGRMHPVTMASKLVRQLEFLSFQTPAGEQVPNDLTAVLHPSDLDPAIDTVALSEELARVAREAADEQGWRYVGPFEVHLETSAAVPKGILQCAGDSAPGRIGAWAQLIASDGSAVVPISLNSSLLGRALDCDLRFSNYEVSRRHAIIRRKAGEATIEDLGSSNGTSINGDRLTTSAAVLTPGCLITIGSLDFTYRLVA